ncbi:MAG: cyclic nucleotide-binding domain-containing protein [Panacagrimonas sp.]
MAEEPEREDVLAMCRHFPEIQLARGDTLIAESVSTDRLYVLKHGAFEVRRNGIALVHVAEPGAFLGEISVLLGSTPTATVVATCPSTVHVVDQASAEVRTRPELTLAIARLLARRLAAVTAYLVDIKRQYADSGTHLGLMDQVLGHLVVMSPNTIEPGSERSDVPDY